MSAAKKPSLRSLMILAADAVRMSQRIQQSDVGRNSQGIVLARLAEELSALGNQIAQDFVTKHQGKFDRSQERLAWEDSASEALLNKLSVMRDKFDVFSQHERAQA